MDFLEACKDVLKNKTEYERDGNLGMRYGGSINGIQFFNIETRSVCSSQALTNNELLADWNLIERKKVTLFDEVRESGDFGIFADVILVSDVRTYLKEYVRWCEKVCCEEEDEPNSPFRKKAEEIFGKEMM